jgi:hypothetical protein
MAYRAPLRGKGTYFQHLTSGREGKSLYLYPELSMEPQYCLPDAVKHPIPSGAQQFYRTLARSNGNPNRASLLPPDTAPTPRRLATTSASNSDQNSRAPSFPTLPEAVVAPQRPAIMSANSDYAHNAASHVLPTPMINVLLNQAVVSQSSATHNSFKQRRKRISECPRCRKQMGTQSIARHKSLHTKTCHVRGCRAGDGDSRTSKRHRREHKEEFMFVCVTKHCTTKWFSSIDDLRDHGFKDHYVCSQCPKKAEYSEFYLETSLHRHEIQHKKMGAGIQQR